ncbi:adhesion G protein-coupled receptor E2 [Callorhinchus milii]|uniref:adhesion G protein-coupled receptor E2 n=1 Tax=Callorhinchus milii TaxID=7868 RepID=UPI001C3FE9DD|nr:adhesion G protein-coupled receptor E2 [Callorhinchus milii]
MRSPRTAASELRAMAGKYTNMLLMIHFGSLAVLSGRANCKDVECKCGNNSKCYNTYQGYFCICEDGFTSGTGEVQFTQKTDCVVISTSTTSDCSSVSPSHQNPAPNGCEPLPKADQSPGSVFCSAMNKTSLKMDGLCHQSAREVTMQDIMSFASQLLADSAAWNRLEQEERLRVASTLLQTMERTAVTLALSLASPGFIHFPDAQLDLQVGVIDTERPPSQQRARLSTQGSSMDINWATIAGGETTGLAAVIFISYSNMDRFLKGAPYRAHTGPPTPIRTHLNSAVISAALSNRQSDPLPEAVNFTLKHKQEPEAGERLVCVYWNHSANGSHWSPRGCELTHCNQTHTSCKCQHLSSFSLLMAFNRELQDSSSDKAQRVITYVGITVSLVCLGTTIITFLVSSKVKNVITATHTQLCVSLFLAELLFLTGINSTSNRVLCGIIAGCLHYLFLAAFAWMSLESVQLYLMVRNLKKMRLAGTHRPGGLLYTLGYVPPAVLVVICAAVYPHCYGSDRNCWLQVEKGFVWTFLGPTYLMILVNTGLFMATLVTLKDELSHRDVEVSKIKDTRMLAFKAVGQVFVLGCTWILGAFHFQKETVVMAYLFTIVNSFQGVFIFILLCLLNRKVRAEYRGWFTAVRKMRRIAFKSELAGIPLTLTSDEP